MKTEIKKTKGGITAPKGFKASGTYCGIKKIAGRKDLAILFSEEPAVCAGLFTTNAVKAHCVVYNKKNLGRKTARAIVINSGNANACNGEQGMKDILRMAELTARELGIDRSEVFVANTGIIGQPLPMRKIETGIKKAAAKLSAKGSKSAALAIMTTDTFPKETAVEFKLGGKTIRIGGIAKGSGMIEPKMATMLAFLATDAAIAKPVLQKILKRVTDMTFNSITVDGDTSTNDMCLLFANGQAGNQIIDRDNSDNAKIFEKALFEVCSFLAKEIARDGEGATKLVEICVKNAKQPELIAKTIANSPLVKTALFGNDPNWGRVLAAAGRSGARFDLNKVDIKIAGVEVFSKGQPTKFEKNNLSRKMRSKNLLLEIDLHQKNGRNATVYTCDFSYDYVKINAEYHT